MTFPYTPTNPARKPLPAEVAVKRRNTVERRARGGRLVRSLSRLVRLAEERRSVSVALPAQVQPAAWLLSMQAYYVVRLIERRLVREYPGRASR